MGCGEFRQVRIGEFLTFTIDSGGVVTSPLSLEDAIDLGGAGTVGVTVTVNNAALDGGQLKFSTRTAPINNGAYYAETDPDDSILLTTDITSNEAFFLQTSSLSRFLSLGASCPTDPTTGATVICTIDVVIRGCSG